MNKLQYIRIQDSITNATATTIIFTVTDYEDNDNSNNDSCKSKGEKNIF